MDNESKWACTNRYSELLSIKKLLTQHGNVITVRTVEAFMALKLSHMT